MNSMHAKIIVALLMIGFLSACGTRATNAPASTSQPTVGSATPTQAPTLAPAFTQTIEPTQALNTQPVAPMSTVSFASDVLPLFESRCRNCHGGNKTEEGLILLSYADIMKGSDNGPVVNPGHADHSLIVEMLVDQKMPKRGPKLTSPQIQLIIDWINQGALEN